MTNNEDMRAYLREKVSRDIIMKYLFIKTIDENYGDEYIKTKYRINAFTIRSLYKALDENERQKLEEEIKEQIESGEIVLEQEAVKWHREALRQEKNIDNDRKEEKGI